MLTIEKRPNILQKAGVLTAAFVIGLVGSMGALYTIDPKNNVTVVRTAETNTHKERQEASTEPVKSSTNDADETTHAQAPVWVQQTYQVTEPTQSIPGEDKSTPKPTSVTKPRTSNDTVVTEDTPSNVDSGLLNLPILELLLP